ncbi:hypothetical protein M427DRAFT_56441 [Gonapodya prolifera JEL478]|uniref:Uncharacterized protein n=1 Tax=Gonapodya prolifera (strain JEL478) TaxID=1344416 RepID=A0A139AHF8_GONPJ|nr:hypothetical protein M427DRAFT_56441 [Gonapodya prolifera JEL478]|eukprot:KXS15875.1 hypothetical protein M427DRAFT_56441 [Gonapodya prolifera JEL478]
MMALLAVSLLALAHTAMVSASPLHSYKASHGDTFATQVPPHSTKHNITSECFQSIHSRPMYRNIARACIPHGDWIADLDEVAIFKAVVTFGASDFLMRQLYEDDGPLREGKGCWAEQIYAHTTAYCSDTCSSALSAYFDSLHRACGDQSLFHPRKWFVDPTIPPVPGSNKDFDSVDTDQFLFGEPPEECAGANSRTDSRSNANHPLMTSHRPRTTPSQHPLTTASPPSPHSFTSFLLTPLESHAEPTTTSTLSASHLFIRTATCTKAHQPFTSPTEQYCPVEARQMVGPQGWLAAIVLRRVDGELGFDWVLDQALVRAYWGKEGRKFGDLCACATSISRALSSIPTDNFDPFPRYLASEFIAFVCSSPPSALIPSIPLSEPLLPDLSPPCIGALHDTRHFKAVSEACLPPLALERMQERGDGPVVGMRAILTYGAVDVYARELYDVDGGGSPCWRNHYESHTKSFCDRRCGDSMEVYFDSVIEACGTEALRAVREYPQGFDESFRGRRRHPEPPLHGRISLGYDGSERCLGGGEPSRGGTVAVLESPRVDDIGLDDHLTAGTERIAAEMRERFRTSSAPSTVNPTILTNNQHTPFRTLFQILNDTRPNTAADLHFAFRLTRSALCAQAPQKSGWWGSFPHPRLTYCNVEAWKAFGASLGRPEVDKEGVSTGWITRPGFEGYLFGGQWPEYRADTDTCACLTAIFNNMPADSPDDALSANFAYKWISLFNLVCRI